MSKKQSKTQDDFESELKSETPTFDGQAFTIVKRGPEDFLIIRIPIDNKNLVAGEIEVVDTASFKLEANEKLKINLVTKGVL